MTDHTGLDRKIEKNADAIAGLLVAMEGFAARERMRGETFCQPHGEAIKELAVEVGKVKVAVANRWPILIASAFGAMIPTAGLFVAMWKLMPDG